MAADKPTHDDDGLKSAAKLFQVTLLTSTLFVLSDVSNLTRFVICFQQSAGIFKHLKETVMMVIQESQPTSDITPDALTAFQHLMLAQAQEIILLKAING